MTRRLQALAPSAAMLAFAGALLGMVHLMTAAARAQAATTIAPTYGQAMLTGAEEAF